MEIIIQPTPEAASRVAAAIVAGVMRSKPNPVLGLATGQTPLRLYRELIAMRLDWRQVRTFNLDEYVGLAREHPQSFHSAMQANLFQHVNIDPANVRIPDGMTTDIPAHCASYEAAIRGAGGIDVQILGIGTDGHIGFNEPSRR
jgi:glucosamine-6-phosphate deaminase